MINNVSENAPAEELSSEAAARLLTGQITLAEYVGIDKKGLYEIAKKAYQMLNSGKLEEAREIYQGLVAADPYDSVFHCHLGVTLARLGDKAAALKEFDSALQYNIANVDAFVGRGEIQLGSGNIKEAVEDLTRAIELDPQGKREATRRARAALLMLKAKLEQLPAANPAAEK